MKFLITLLILFGCIITAPAIQARESGWQSADYLQARLLGAGKTENGYMAALDIRLADGWHTYWRMPGDAGLPPQLSWEGSQNLKSAGIIWPAPERFEVMGLYSFGYEDRLLLPLRIEPFENSKPLKLDLQAEIMVCRDICVPQSVSVQLDMPDQAADKSQYWPRIKRALEEVPHEGNLPGLKIENTVIGPSGIVVTAFSQNGYDDIDLFAEAGDVYITAKPEITPDEQDSRKALLRIAAPEGIDNLADVIMGEDLRLTLVNGRQAIEKTISF